MISHWPPHEFAPTQLFSCVLVSHSLSPLICFQCVALQSISSIGFFFLTLLMTCSSFNLKAGFPRDVGEDITLFVISVFGHCVRHVRLVTFFKRWEECINFTLSHFSFWQFLNYIYTTVKGQNKDNSHQLVWFLSPLSQPSLCFCIFSSFGLESLFLSLSVGICRKGKGWFK